MTLDRAMRHWLNQTFGQAVVYDEPMARHTYFRVGGPADAFVSPDTLDALLTLIQWLKKNGLPHMVIGGGSNLLVKDGGIRGVVISLRRCLNKIEHAEKNGGVVSLTSGAGVKLQSLWAYAAERGFEGMNFAVGIPGTVGGGIVMNAGTRYGCIGDVLDTVTILDSDLNRLQIAKEQLQFSYRTLKWNADIEKKSDARPLILGAGFRLHTGDREKIRREIERIRKERRQRQPVGEASAGCFFKNPGAGNTAGQLIDMAGLKGRSVGGAAVSEAHANFIINKGTATAQDILELKDTIQDTVFKLFQIKLEIEVKIVGSPKAKKD